MKYRIKYIKSNEKKWRRGALVACVLLFFLCLSLSSFYMADRTVKKGASFAPFYVV